MRNQAFPLFRSMFRPGIGRLTLPQPSPCAQPHGSKETKDVEVQNSDGLRFGLRPLPGK